MRHSGQQDYGRGSSFSKTNMSLTSSPFPGKRSFVRNEDADDELGRCLKRIRLDGGSVSSDDCDVEADPARHSRVVQCLPSPGELCVQRDLQDSLANHLLQSSSSQGIYDFRNGGTLTQVTSTQFLFSFESRAQTMVTVSLTIPKRYPHQPPLLSIVSAATALEQQCFADMIAVSPTTANNNTVLWSPVHKLTDVLGWILRFVPTAEPQRQASPKRLSHPSVTMRR